jgi:hypothetical protein
MRRVFYLEHDHYKERREELAYLSSLKDEEERFQQRRPPWVPHPEIRETVPNIAIYSVLFCLPRSLRPQDENMTYQKQLEWQLAQTSKFFDKCVPNQPGFSSSVAAVTILPPANRLYQAWHKWYKAAAKVRRLRFIKNIIEDKKREMNDAEPDVEAGTPGGSFPFCKTRKYSGVAEQKSVEPEVKKNGAASETKKEKAPATPVAHKKEESKRVEGAMTHESVLGLGDDCPSPIQVMTGEIPQESYSFEEDGGEEITFEVEQDAPKDPLFEQHGPMSYSYRDFDKSKLGFSRMVGLFDDNDEKADEHDLFMLSFGVEQTAVYSHEFAKR